MELPDAIGRQKNLTAMGDRGSLYSISIAGAITSQIANNYAGAFFDASAVNDRHGRRGGQGRDSARTKGQPGIKDCIKQQFQKTVSDGQSGKDFSENYLEKLVNIMVPVPTLGADASTRLLTPEIEIDEDQSSLHQVTRWANIQWQRYRYYSIRTLEPQGSQHTVYTPYTSAGGDIF